ncbi:DUF2304 domain-containing protein [Dorea sp. D27]|uniref:DUF2304 domain-containing protein n=1 Tax=Dorea sp. D27 TaxID=658665 RepID=UPI0006A0E197|nr:DUF2304 domain-containing protein [Dorea sp. D27]KMZ55349.1 putative membrane protein [Dorea sp. D27]
MSIVLKVISIAVCLLMVYGLCQEMKKRNLSENQAILWLGGVLGLLLLSAFPQILSAVAGFLGIWWPPAALIFFLLVVIILIILRHTVTISGMEAEIKELAMQLTLLKDENEEIKKELGRKIKGEQE